MKSSKLLFFFVALTFALLPFMAHATTYAVTNQQVLAGPTRWDYLSFDNKRQRLYITRGDRVDVYGLAQKQIIGSIEDTNGVHGIAFTRDLKRGFTSNGKTNTSTVFDMETLQVIGVINVGAHPDAIVYDPATRRVFTANAESKDLTVIDAMTGNVLGTLPLHGKPEFMVVDGRGRLYVNLESTSELAIIDTKEGQMIARYSLKPDCEGPTGLSIDAKNGHLFVSCHNKTLVVVNDLTGVIIDKLPIGEGSDATLYDQKTNLVFSSNGEGNVTVIDAKDPAHHSVVETVNTLPGARTMALNPTNHEIYLVTAESDGFEPPTDEHPEPHRHYIPDTLTLLTLGITLARE